jgi:hypothetical protein
MTSSLRAGEGSTGSRMGKHKALSYRMHQPLLMGGDQVRSNRNEEEENARGCSIGEGIGWVGVRRGMCR